MDTPAPANAATDRPPEITIREIFMTQALVCAVIVTV